MLWPAFDTALCKCARHTPCTCIQHASASPAGPSITKHWTCARSIIKAELEPFLKDNLPSVVSGMYFERLSFGLVPMSILGVRSVPSYHTDQHIAIGAALSAAIALHALLFCC
jgi:hypothetical protein